MHLESLANELLLDLFEFMDTINLLRTFHGLNARFDQLIFTRLQRCHLDFRSLSKYDFDIVCQQYLPSIMNRVISLHLSDDLETPNVSQIFLSNGYRINQFINLKSLSIDFIYSFDILNEMTSQCRELLYLTHLRIRINNQQDLEEHFRDFINNIWSLRKLTHCHLDITYPYTTWLMEMSVISPSINYLSTSNINYGSNNLHHLFRHTPHLRRFSIGYIGYVNDEQHQTIFPSLISLNMAFRDSVQWTKNFFQMLPNLCYLTVRIDDITLDGSAWEKILSSCFKNIKVFRLKMTVNFDPSEDIEEQVDQLLDSFRTHFWIEKHRWFVRCDWCPTEINKSGLLHTLPYAFDTFYYTDGNQSKSTSPHSVDYSSYNQVKTLHHTDRKKDVCVNWTDFPIRFVNLRHLIIKLPINDNFWSVIPTLDQLISLDVTLNQDSGYSQLQVMIDRAPHLYSLSFCHLNKFSMSSFNISSKSIRRLEFFQTFGFRARYFKSAECTILANSPLASQCEVLIIDVDNRTDIFEITNAMPNLRALSVCCRDNTKNQYQALETNADFMAWLQDHLPSKYTYSINRNIYQISHINLWIHKGI